MAIKLTSRKIGQGSIEFPFKGKSIFDEVSAVLAMPPISMIKLFNEALLSGPTPPLSPAQQARLKIESERDEDVEVPQTQVLVNFDYMNTPVPYRLHHTMLFCPGCGYRDVYVSDRSNEQDFEDGSYDPGPDHYCFTCRAEFRMDLIRESGFVVRTKIQNEPPLPPFDWSKPEPEPTYQTGRGIYDQMDTNRLPPFKGYH